jgi:hypothetical protein
MNTRVIPTKVHGVVDYASAPALTAVPALLGLDRRSASAIAPRVAGASGTAISALTDYELGAKRVIPMRAHLAFDGLTGVAVAAAPWLFGSARRGPRYWLPHALVGVTDVALALTTRTRPQRLGRFRMLQHRMARLAARRPGTRVLVPVAGSALVLGMVVRRMRRRSAEKAIEQASTPQEGLTKQAREQEAAGKP